MAIYKGNTKIVKLYKGSTEIVRRYKGTNLIYQNSLLPSGYIECEYLESTGTAYIDTLLTGNENTKIVIDAACVGVSSSGTSGQLLGYFETNKSITLQFTTSSTAPSRFGTYSFVYNTFTFNERAVYEIDASGYKKNGVYLHQNSTAQSFETGNLYLFRCNGSTTVGSFRIYDYKIYASGVLVQHLIPCLDTSGVPCMYDVVSGDTLYNAGTGTFSFKIKVEIPENYTLCDYIENTGTQYIDTGLTSSNDVYDFIIVASATSNTPSVGVPVALFGSTNGYNVSIASMMYRATGQVITNILITESRFDAIHLVSNPAQSSIDLDINGNTFSGSYSNFTYNNNFGIFGYGNGNSKTICRIKYFQIKKNNKLIGKFIPCLDNNNVPCMYDVITKQTYYNAGTGDFAYD